MPTQTPQPGENGTEPGRSPSVSPNMSLSGTLQEHRHQFIHCNAVNVATKNMTQDAHLKIVSKTESSMNKKQHAIGCEYIHLTVYDGQLPL
jgi:hypothetical protein